MSVCLCVFVCLCVCVWHLYSQNCYVDFDETLHNWSNIWLVISFLSIFDHLNLTTSWRPFWICPVGHSHGCNFAPIFFEFEYKLIKKYVLLFWQKRSAILVYVIYLFCLYWRASNKRYLYTMSFKFCNRSKQNCDHKSAGLKKKLQNGRHTSLI